MTTILAIETSCDETAVAVLEKQGNEIHVLADAIASQIDIHKATGGVVPEAAAREHTRVIKPLIRKVLEDAKIKLPLIKEKQGFSHLAQVRGSAEASTEAYSTVRRERNVGANEGIGQTEGEVVGQSPASPGLETTSVEIPIDAIAVTTGPGLMPALSVGVTAARTLAFAWNKPIIPVHHIEGHIYSALLQSSNAEISNLKFKISKPFPALALIVSGGHTLLIEVRDHLQYKIIGTTRDDAVGEAFDKVARLLGLPYPGGPQISRIAKEGDSAAFDFPRPMINSGDLDFSFSGLKTSVLYTLRDLTNPTEQDKANIAASFEQAVIDTLIAKTAAALRGRRPERQRRASAPYKTLLLAGGVAANQKLRQALTELAATENITLQIAPQNLCGDNAVMIGQVGLLAFEKNRAQPWRDLDPVARVSIEKFSNS